MRSRNLRCRCRACVSWTRWRRGVAWSGGRYVGGQGRVINKYIDRQPGVWLAAPFRLKDGTHIVVMRGWVPETESDVEPPKGEQTVVGMLRDGSGDLGAHLDGDEFRSLDGYATLAQYDLKNAVGRIVIEGALVPHGQAFPKALPRRGFYGFVIRRPHREYAGTWFGLAFALFAMGLCRRPPGSPAGGHMIAGSSLVYASQHSS